MKIIFTGGAGRFGTVFKEKTLLKKVLYPNKKELNIQKLNSIQNYFKKNKPKIVIHAAGLSRPMAIHDKEVAQSIDKNIIGTSNLVKACIDHNIKIIYLSTGYVYPGTKGNYKENDSLLPYNNYAWSKLGGECAVQMYKNSLIVRLCMTEKPFVHKYAFKDLITNFIFHEEVVMMFPKILKLKGIVNVGGKSSSAYNFAKKFDKKVLGILSKKLLKNKIPLNHSMNLGKLNKILND
tara:strand:+ start:2286 stop:2993 length:708 start_codon:yes stop_codon:yes gene_type:complete